MLMCRAQTYVESTPERRSLGSSRATRSRLDWETQDTSVAFCVVTVCAARVFAVIICIVAICVVILPVLCYAKLSMKICMLISEEFHNDGLLASNSLSGTRRVSTSIHTLRMMVSRNGLGGFNLG